jgi:hypothetical protein
MRTIRRHWRLTCLILAALVLGTGCNLISMPFFLFGPDDKIPAGMKKLASDDKEVKVLIWSWADRDVRANLEIPHADRKLAEKLYNQLKTGCEKNKEKVALISPRKADEYRIGREDVDPKDAGKHFDVDYVIYLEVEKFSLTVKHSFDEVLQGEAAIKISLLNLKSTDEPTPPELFECSFPEGSEGGYEVTDTGNSKQAFCNRFLDYVAHKLSWKFTAHLQDEDNNNVSKLHQ